MKIIDLINAAKINNTQSKTMTSNRKLVERG